VRPHKGTDFAAPIGTPIMATANGTVTKSGYTSGNGNYVKIRHNATYETQYLHMSKRIAKVGQFVKQGDVIGLVGMTGHAAGPHVCYRFWKNGRQVDPLREKLPEAEPISKNLKERYFDFIKPIKAQLDSIPFKVVKEEKLGKPIENNLISQIK
jgi:murein DD-endopeptidase MepM/ murein hydrolase activator NlpD